MTFVVNLIYLQFSKFDQIGYKNIVLGDKINSFSSKKK